MRVGKVTKTSATMREVALEATLIAGPETAARLGVPVGTPVDLGTLAYWHRNPIRRFWGRLTRRRH